MKRYLLLIISLLCLFSSCKHCLSSMFPCEVAECMPWNSIGKYPKGYLVENEMYDRYVYDRIMYHVAEMAVKFRFERRMKLENSTLQFDGCIQSMRLDFSTMALLELQEGREILVDITEDFLRRINSDSTIAGALCQGYLTSHDIEVQINFQCWMGKIFDFDYVGWITLKHGWAHFYAFDMRADTLDWWQLRNETYYETFKIVEYTRQAEASLKQREADKAGPSAFKNDRFMFNPDNDQ